MCVIAAAVAEVCAHAFYMTLWSQVVAAAMAEVTTGESYQALFQRLLKTPLGMNASYQQTTQISGSLQASVADYSKFVRAIYHSGTGEGGDTLLSLEAVQVCVRVRVWEWVCG